VLSLKNIPSDELAVSTADMLYNDIIGNFEAFTVVWLSESKTK